MMYKILLFLFLPIALHAQKNYQAVLDTYMQAQVKVNKFNGNVLMARSGEVIYQKAFGYRNYDTKEELNINSVFELGSVSKQFTAMGILLLAEKGKLKLSDTLRKFFPELPYSQLTLHQMLCHTSGLPDYGEAMMNKWDPKKVAFNQDMIDFMASHKVPAEFKPGERFQYSNTGYAILASVLEKVSGQSFKEYMQQHIFQLLGMHHTRVYNTRRSKKEVIPNYAYGFVYADSLKKYILPDSLPQYHYVYWLAGIQGDGTINSTVGDLLIWDRALKNHLLLSEKTQKQMLSPQATDTTYKLNYGYGVMLFTDENGDKIAHNVLWPGYFTNLTRYVGQDLTIVVLSNNQSHALAVSSALTHIVFNKEVIIPYVHKEVSIDDTIVDKYVG